MFVLSYSTIYFFVKKFIFLNVYFSMNMIFECIYMFFGWERGYQLSTCRTTVGMRVFHPKCVQMLAGRGGIMLHVYIRMSVHVTRGFELVTCGFKLVARVFKSVTHGFKVVARRVELVNLNCWIWTRNSWIWTRTSEF